MQRAFGCRRFLVEDELVFFDGDENGVALAAIQGLSAIVKEKEAQIRKLEAKTQSLEKRLQALEARLGLDAEQDGTIRRTGGLKAGGHFERVHGIDAAVALRRSEEHSRISRPI